MPSKKPLKRSSVKPGKKIAAIRKTMAKPARRPARTSARSRTRFDEPAMTERLPGTVTPPPAPVPVPAPKAKPVVPAVPVQPLEQAVPEVPTTTTETPAPEKAGISGEELYKRIQFEAHLLGERDGFKADPVHYWIQAERAVKKSLRG